MTSKVMTTPSTPMNAETSSTQAGAWKHPRFKEIARRQYASTFTDRNIKQIAYNLSGLLAVWICESVIESK
jgi:nucleoporin POM34